MSYGRDPDRHTRTAGAIASRDNANPTAARARAQAKNQRTVHHDRVMRTMTYGAKGGMSTLGALNLGYQGGASSPWTGGVRGGTGLTFDGGQTNRPPVVTAPGSGGGATATSTATVSRPVMKAVNAMNIAAAAAMPTVLPIAVIPSSTPTTYPAGIPAAMTSTALPTKTVTKAPVVVTGGGGAWVPVRTPVTPLPGLEPVELPDVPTGKAPAISTKTLAILGGAAALAYLLLRKPKRETP